jgi:multidrug efflux pump subunit AcrB
MPHRTDADLIQTTHNTSRFFVEHRAVSWVLLVAVAGWGIFGYLSMPKRKDPDIPVRLALAVCPWPGVSAEKVEQLVTRTIEAAIEQNSTIHPPGPGTDYGIRSVTLDGVAYVYIQLAENVADTLKQFSDINLKLKAINNLPSGAGPIQFYSDYGDTTTLMLTVASPKVSEVEVELRARAVEQKIKSIRGLAHQSKPRISLVSLYPPTLDSHTVEPIADDLSRYLLDQKLAADIQPLEGADFRGLDLQMLVSEPQLSAAAFEFVNLDLGRSTYGSLHPDAWAPVAITDPGETRAKMMAVAGDKYTYAELEKFTDLIQRTLNGVPEVSKSARTGVLPQAVTLVYSDQRLASYGLQPSKLSDLLVARNITRTAGMINAGGVDVTIHPSGEFTRDAQIGSVIVATSQSGSPVYLRDLVTITRNYQSPPQLLNFYNWRGADGKWRRSRAVTLSIFMRSGGQVGRFGASVDKALDSVRGYLPEDLIIERTSDQPRQVRENVDLFMDALYEAIVLVVIVSWLGFREWRSALLIALSIPITLAMTFGMMYVLGIDVQQVSIAALIIALGLLVDDPVVAGDAIKNELSRGHPPVIAGWLGPTKLAKPILFATITNVVAYLPFLLLTGDTGWFLYSLPIVMTCALISSRIVSMTFVPHLGYYLMRANKTPEPTLEERRRRGVTGFYFRVGSWALEHRWKVFLGSLAFLAVGVIIAKQLATSFFPDDVQYLAYVDVWSPNGAAISQTNDVVKKAEAIISQAAEQYGQSHPGHDGKPRRILKSVTSFVGGGGPRFWFSVSPESPQPNYAQIILEIYDKDDMPELIGPLQDALSAGVPGAWLDVRQLQTNPVRYPLEIHIGGLVDFDPTREQADITELRRISTRVEEVLRAIPGTRRVRSDWFGESMIIRLPIDPDRANLAGITNNDVADSTTALSGSRLGTLLDGDLRISIIARLRRTQRSALSDINSLYVYSSSGTQRVPITSVASVGFALNAERIVRRDQFRAITVICFPRAGILPSQILAAAWPELKKIETSLPPGYSIAVGGEYSKQTQGFRNMMEVLAISVALIFVALVIQFNSMIKPLLVFAAVPYGAVGALAALYIMGVPFGFMAFLGIASLVGVIVSHVIVLFDFVEERERLGDPLIEGLLDAGIQRLRPIVITVGATVLALFPLTLHGGPLWQPLCYAQIGGLCLATIIELILIMVLYPILVADLGVLKWGPEPPPDAAQKRAVA